VVRKDVVLMAMAAALLVVMFSGPGMAWSGVYHLDKEWVKIWINPDGSIDLFYNMTLSLESGDNIHSVNVGQPNSY
jgi:hypothetical protein